MILFEKFYYDSPSVHPFMQATKAPFLARFQADFQEFWSYSWKNYKPYSAKMICFLFFNP